MTNRQMERRGLRGLVEVRAADKTMRIGGYAAKFNTRSQNLGGYVETIDPGFFRKSEADGWPGVMARYNHEDGWLLGTIAGETLRLKVDGTGLDYEVDMPQHRADVYELVQRRDVQRSSIAFYTFEEDWSLDDNGFPMRTLLSGQLVDVAPVNTPAYQDTSTGLRSLAELRGLDLAEVASRAAAGDLASLLSAPPIVVDLGARSEPTTPTDPAPEPQVSATVPARVEALRLLLDKKSKPI